MTTETYLLVLTTTGEREQALVLANALVERSIAACAQIVGPITSVYRWKGIAETAEEWQVQAKVPESRYQEAEACLKELHAYELPEIVTVSLERGSPEYFAWMKEATLSGP